MTNSSQTVTGSINFDSFGNTAGTSGSSSNPYMYAGDWGYRNDGDAGLTHVGARYYDAQVGRFITRDTFLNQHPYLYCEHDPVNGVDPSGHAYLDFHFTKEDWIRIADGIEDWGKGEQQVGGTIGSIVGIPALVGPPAYTGPAGSLIPGGPSVIIMPRIPIKQIAVVGVGIWVGGTVSRGISRGIKWVVSFF